MCPSTPGSSQVKASENQTCYFSENFKEYESIIWLNIYPQSVTGFQVFIFLRNKIFLCFFVFCFRFFSLWKLRFKGKSEVQVAFKVLC